MLAVQGAHLPAAGRVSAYSLDHDDVDEDVETGGAGEDLECIYEGLEHSLGEVMCGPLTLGLSDVSMLDAEETSFTAPLETLQFVIASLRKSMAHKAPCASQAAEIDSNFSDTQAEQLKQVLGSGQQHILCNGSSTQGADGGMATPSLVTSASARTISSTETASESEEEVKCSPIGGGVLTRPVGLALLSPYALLGQKIFTKAGSAAIQ